MSFWAERRIFLYALSKSVTVPKEENMADDAHELSEREVTMMLKRAGITLPAEQLEKCCTVVARLEAAARRLRKDLERCDEPASAFIRR
jgi:hypothetical protein